MTEMIGKGEQGQAPRRRAGGSACVWALALVAAAAVVTGCRESGAPDGGGAEAGGGAQGGGAAAARGAERVPPAAPPRAAAPPVDVDLVGESRPRPTGPLPPGTSCSTAGCHADIQAARFVHGAVSTGDCFACHAPDRGGHVYPLVRPGNDLCTFCHTVTGDRTYVHRAVDVGGCVACHRPHGSGTKFLLTAASVDGVCLSCHEMEPGMHAHGAAAGVAATGAGGAGAGGATARGASVAGASMGGAGVGGVGGVGCTACHDPHESDATNLLRGGDVPAHCYLCHAEMRQVMTTAANLHAPASACTTCHTPHATDFDHALRRSMEDTCFACHADLEAVVAGATAPHAAVFTADRCANCHDAHGAGQPYLLREPQQVLCLQCHDREMKAADGRTIRDMRRTLSRRFLHGPVASGNCSACHAVHGGSYARLLRDRFTPAFYQAFDLGSYALCFDCHESELVLTERTTALTDFRNGEQNLHYVHVNREKGRTCRTCHDIHGSDLPKHMAETVPFEGSGWSMPIQFVKTNDGGRCGPGCHEPRSYSRLPEIAPPDLKGGPP